MGNNNGNILVLDRKSGLLIEGEDSGVCAFGDSAALSVRRVSWRFYTRLILL